MRKPPEDPRKQAIRTLNSYLRRLGEEPISEDLYSEFTMPQLSERLNRTSERARSAQTHDARAAARRARERTAQRGERMNRLIEQTSELESGAASFAAAAKKLSAGSQGSAANPFTTVSRFLKRTFTRDPSPKGRTTSGASSSPSSSSSPRTFGTNPLPESRAAGAASPRSVFSGQVGERSSAPWADLFEEEDDDRVVVEPAPAPAPRQSFLSRFTSGSSRPTPPSRRSRSRRPRSPSPRHASPVPGFASFRLVGATQEQQRRFVEQEQQIDGLLASLRDARQQFEAQDDLRPGIRHPAPALPQPQRRWGIGDRSPSSRSSSSPTNVAPKAVVPHKTTWFDPPPSEPQAQPSAEHAEALQQHQEMLQIFTKAMDRHVLEKAKIRDSRSAESLLIHPLLQALAEDLLSSICGQLPDINQRAYKKKVVIRKNELLINRERFPHAFIFQKINRLKLALEKATNDEQARVALCEVIARFKDVIHGELIKDPVLVFSRHNGDVYAHAYERESYQQYIKSGRGDNCAITQHPITRVIDSPPLVSRLCIIIRSYYARLEELSKSTDDQSILSFMKSDGVDADLSPAAERRNAKQYLFKFLEAGKINQPELQQYVCTQALGPGLVDALFHYLEKHRKKAPTSVVEELLDKVSPQFTQADCIKGLLYYVMWTKCCGLLVKIETIAHAKAINTIDILFDIVCLEQKKHTSDQSIPTFFYDVLPLIVENVTILDDKQLNKCVALMINGLPLLDALIRKPGVKERLTSLIITLCQSRRSQAKENFIYKFLQYADLTAMQREQLFLGTLEHDYDQIIRYFIESDCNIILKIALIYGYKNTLALINSHFSGSPDILYASLLSALPNVLTAPTIDEKPLPKQSYIFIKNKISTHKNTVAELNILIKCALQFNCLDILNSINKGKGFDSLVIAALEELLSLPQGERGFIGQQISWRIVSSAMLAKDNILKTLLEAAIISQSNNLARWLVFVHSASRAMQKNLAIKICPTIENILLDPCPLDTEQHLLNIRTLTGHAAQIGDHVEYFLIQLFQDKIDDSTLIDWIKNHYKEHLAMSCINLLSRAFLPMQGRKALILNFKAVNDKLPALLPQKLNDEQVQSFIRLMLRFGQLNIATHLHNNHQDICAASLPDIIAEVLAMNAEQAPEFPQATGVVLELLGADQPEPLALEQAQVNTLVFSILRSGRLNILENLCYYYNNKIFEALAYALGEIATIPVGDNSRPNILTHPFVGMIDQLLNAVTERLDQEHINQLMQLTLQHGYQGVDQWLVNSQAHAEKRFPAIMSLLPIMLERNQLDMNSNIVIRILNGFATHVNQNPQLAANTVSINNVESIWLLQVVLLRAQQQPQLQAFFASQLARLVGAAAPAEAEAEAQPDTTPQALLEHLTEHLLPRLNSISECADLQNLILLEGHTPETPATGQLQLLWRRQSRFGISFNGHRSAVIGDDQNEHRDVSGKFSRFTRSLKQRGLAILTEDPQGQIPAEDSREYRFFAAPTTRRIGADPAIRQLQRIEREQPQPGQ